MTRSPPKIVISAQTVSLRDSAEVNLNDQNLQYCGLFNLTRTGANQFIIQLFEPNALTAANWTSVTVTAPPHWLSTPSPWPPAAVTDTVIDWTPHDTKAKACLSVPDTR
jgi:hypothetical protein